MLARFTAAVLIAASSVLVTPCLAQEDIGAVLDRAKSNLTAKPVEAFVALETAQRLLWDQMPLSFRIVALAERVGTTNQLKPKTDKIYAPNTPIVVFFQPLGYGRKQEGDRVEVSLLFDFELMDGTGRAVALKRDNACKLSGTQAFPRVNCIINIGQVAKPGDYVVKIGVRDENSKKQGQTELTLTVKG